MFDRKTVTDGGLETDLIFHHGVEMPVGWLGSNTLRAAPIVPGNGSVGA